MTPWVIAYGFCATVAFGVILLVLGATPMRANSLISWPFFLLGAALWPLTALAALTCGLLLLLKSRPVRT